MSPARSRWTANELGALLVAAGLGPPLEHALISLPALNGLRVSEATSAGIEHLGLDRGHRTPSAWPPDRALVADGPIGTRR